MGPSYTFDERIDRAIHASAARGQRIVYCDMSATRNNGGRGTPDAPFNDFEDAYARLVEGRGDTLLLAAGPATGTSTDMTVRLAETFVWAKPNTHLIGVSENCVGQRSRITGPSSGGTFQTLLSVTAHGCKFKNFSIFDDYTVDPVAMKVTGQRNYFENVNIQGMGAATGADDAAGTSLWMVGAAENYFYKCVIGLDTIPRSTTNGEILMASACTRNKFDDCDIVSYSDNAGHLFVSANTSGALDRWTIFHDCRFHNAPTGIASGTTMTQAMAVHASAGGYIWLTGSSSCIGATDWAAADNGNVFVDRVVAAAATAGLAVAVTR